MQMLQLRSQKICDEFKVNKRLYKNKIGVNEERRLQYIEQLIVDQSTEFLSDPEYWIEQWESLSGEDIPSKYIQDLPKEITGTNAVVNKNSRTFYFYRFLPVINKKGDRIKYPNDRQVFNHKSVYILQDNLMEALSISK